MTSSAQAVIDLQATAHPLEFFNEFATVEDFCLSLMHRRAYEEVASRSHGKRVLDLGCNNGWGTDFLSSVAASVTGIDVSAAAVADARRRFPNGDFHLFDGLSLPFETGAFDLVASLQVIEHVPDTGPYLREIMRVLTPGGTAIFTTPNAAIRLDPGMKPWNRFHVREYLAAELHDDLAREFSRVTVRGLSAVDELYQVEYRRCQKALQAARRPPAPRKPSLAGLVKSVLPEPLVDRLRRLRSATPSLPAAAPSSIDPEFLARYSTADLFYRDDDLGAAIDLIAICAKGGAAAGSA
jgi:SAM-dependent methyltransferase